MGGERDPLRGRLGLDHRRAQHQVGAQQGRDVVRERQHVGGVVLAAELAVQRQALGGVDHAHGDLGGHGKRSPDRARDVGARQHGAMARVGELKREAQRRSRAARPGARPLSGALRRPRHRPRRCARQADGGRRRPTEARGRDALDVAQDLLGVDQARHGALRQIDLAGVAGDHSLGAEADQRQGFVHLLGRRVLRLVEDDEGVVERAAAHVRERGDLDMPLSNALRTRSGPSVVQGVVQRAKVRVHLRARSPGRKPSRSPASTAGRIRMTRFTVAPCASPPCHGQVRLAGARGGCRT